MEPSKKPRIEKGAASTSTGTEEQMDIDTEKNSKVSSTILQYQFLLDSFTLLVEKVRPKYIKGNISLAIAVSGPLRSFCQFLKRRHGGMKQTSELAKAMKQNGITIHYGEDAIVIPTAEVEKHCDIFWDSNITEITNAGGAKNFFGTLMQIVHYATNFEYNFTCLRIMESTVKPSKDKSFKPRRTIADIGLDTQAHCPLARGFAKPDVIMSSDPLGLGFATIVYMAIYSPEERKAKWIRALKNQLFGMPNHAEVADIIAQKKTNWQELVKVIANILTIIGQRYVHRYAPMFTHIVQFICEESSIVKLEKDVRIAVPVGGNKLEINKEKLKLMNFTNMECLKDIISQEILVPDQEPGEKWKFAYVMSSLGAIYEDLGIIKQWVGINNTFKRREMEQTIKDIKKAIEPPSTKWRTNFKYYAKARKGTANPESLLKAKGQISSDPVTNGYRMKGLKRAQEYMGANKRQRTSGYVIDTYNDTYDNLMEAIKKGSMDLGNKKWNVYADGKFKEVADILRETEEYYYE